MNIAGEGAEKDTKRVLDRRIETTSRVFEDAELWAFADAELSSKAAPIKSINDTDIAYNLNNTTLGNSTNTNTDVHSLSDVLWTVLGPICFLFFCVYGHRAHVPSSQYHRGAMIRRQAERVWAIQRMKTERQAISTETRESQINESLSKMKIVSKCDRTGHCILGALEVEEQKTKHKEDDGDTKEGSTTTGEEPKFVKAEGFEYMVEEAASVTSKGMATMSDARSTVTEDEIFSSPPSTTDAVASTVVSAAAVSSSKSDMKCLESPGRSKRKLLMSSDSKVSEKDSRIVEQTKELPRSYSNNSAAAVNPSCYDGFDDDEDVCPICLDNFELGDFVMWSRYNHGSCSHAFHEDCLLQWLLEQRENECPTCRACFIADSGTNSTVSSSSSTTDTNENSTIELDEREINFIDEETMDDESNGDIEEGNGNITNSDNIHNDINNRGDCIDDIDDVRDQEHKLVDRKEENDSLKIDSIDEMEEGFTYIIVKGSVQRVPS